MANDLSSLSSKSYGLLPVTGAEHGLTVAPGRLVATHSALTLLLAREG